MPALAAVLLVTAIWGVTFVQVKDAVAIYPLLAFLGVRFAIASGALAVPAAGRVRALGRGGIGVGVILGALVAASFGFQTAGLERTTVSATGFITGLYVVITPLLALVLFRARIGAAVWIAAVVAVVGLGLLSGVDTGSAAGDALVLACAVAQAFQIVLVERFGIRYDAVALVFVEMLTCAAGFLVLALAAGDLAVPHGRTVWAALLVTGIFASAFAFLVQLWAQRRLSAARIALLFALEAPFAALFGYLLAGDRLGPVGWAGCALILAAIALAEPTTADLLGRLARRPRTAP